MLASIHDGIQAWDAQPDLAMKVIDDYAKIGDTDILKKTYDFYTKAAPLSRAQPSRRCPASKP